MTAVTFGAFAPDLAPYNPAAVEVAKNVIPQADGYAPFPSLSAYSSALAGQPQGLFYGKASGGTIETFSATTDELYQLNKTTLAWDDVGRVSAYTGDATDGWDFALFGDRVISVNINDEVQYFDIGTSSIFADLPGSPPKAKRVAIVGDFVVLYGLNGETNALHWSGLNNSEQWTIGQNASDKQVFPDGGEVQFVAPVGTGAIVIQENKIRQMTFLPGDPLVFRFDTLEAARGAVSPRSCVQVGSTVYFLAEDGFYSISPGSAAQPIGAQRVDRYFLDNLDLDSITYVQGAADPVRKMVIWRYSETESESTDKALCYHWQLNKWSQLDGVTMFWMAANITPNISLETIGSLYATLEDIPVSLDSRLWNGGRPVFAAFDEDYKLAFFEGMAMEATVETADLQLVPGKKAFLRAWRPMVDTTNAYGTVATRKSYTETRTWKSEKTMRDSGRINANARGYLHRFRVRIPAGETWDTLQGVDVVEATVSGNR